MFYYEYMLKTPTVSTTLKYSLKGIVRSVMGYVKVFKSTILLPALKCMASSSVALNYLFLKNVGAGSLLSTKSIKVIGSEIYEG